METLQLAQMLADLSDLNAADPRAAHALVNANKTPSSPSTPMQTATDTTPTATATIEPTSNPSNHPVSAVPRPQQHRRISSSSALASTPFDTYLGRHFLTPPITRSASSHGSLPGTPREAESDIERASSFVALYELRAKLKQYNDSTSLRQAREKITALSLRQQQQQQQQQHTFQTTRDAVTSATSPQRQDTPTTRQPTQYTFPRS